MDDNQIHGRIEQLVAEEHQLWDREARGWDLLRQRRARREFGQNPDDAQLRDPGTVEGYLG